MPEVLTGGGIPIASPATVAHHTMRYENAAIHRMLPKNVMMKNFFSGKNIREKRFIYKCKVCTMYIIYSCQPFITNYVLHRQTYVLSR